MELAKKLKMEPGKFYCYYKPSPVNGFVNPEAKSNTDFYFAQVTDPRYRDEITLLESKD